MRWLLLNAARKTNGTSRLWTHAPPWCTRCSGLPTTHSCSAQRRSPRPPRSSSGPRRWAARSWAYRACRTWTARTASANRRLGGSGDKLLGFLLQRPRASCATAPSARRLCPWRTSRDLRRPGRRGRANISSDESLAERRGSEAKALDHSKLWAKHLLGTGGRRCSPEGREKERPSGSVERPRKMKDWSKVSRQRFYIRGAASRSGPASTLRWSRSSTPPRHGEARPRGCPEGPQAEGRGSRAEQRSLLPDTCDIKRSKPAPQDTPPLPTHQHAVPVHRRQRLRARATASRKSAACHLHRAVQRMSATCNTLRTPEAMPVEQMLSWSVQAVESDPHAFVPVRRQGRGTGTGARG